MFFVAALLVHSVRFQEFQVQFHIKFLGFTHSEITTS